MNKKRFCNVCYVAPALQSNVFHSAFTQHHLTYGCRDCWIKHIKIRAGKHNDLRCISCPNDVSYAFLTDYLHLSEKTIQKWKRNFQNAVEEQKDGNQHRCETDGCRGATFALHFGEGDAIEQKERDAITKKASFIWSAFALLMEYCGLGFMLPEEEEEKPFMKRVVTVCTAGHRYNSIINDKNKFEILTNTRPCPNCFVRIHRIEGCNHMKCTTCTQTFCYACARKKQDNEEGCDCRLR